MKKAAAAAATAEVAAAATAAAEPEHRIRIMVCRLRPSQERQLSPGVAESGLHRHTLRRVDDWNVSRGQLTTPESPLGRSHGGDSGRPAPCPHLVSIVYSSRLHRGFLLPLDVSIWRQFSMQHLVEASFSAFFCRGVACWGSFLCVWICSSSRSPRLGKKQTLKCCKRVN